MLIHHNFITLYFFCIYLKTLLSKFVRKTTIHAKPLARLYGLRVIFILELAILLIVLSCFEFLFYMESSTKKQAMLSCYTLHRLFFVGNLTREILL